MKKTLAWVASIVLFIELLDTTLLYSCVVPVAQDFAVTPSQMSLAIIAYTIGSYILVPASAWLASRYNRLIIISSTLGAFALFSVICSLSSELYGFSIFRFLQGIAISISSSVTIITLLSLCDSHEIVKIMGFINIPALIGTAIGPFFGSVLSYYLSWRLAFIINLPICLILISVLFRLRTSQCFQPPISAVRTRLDWIGLLLISSSLMITSIGFEQLSHAFTRVNALLITLGISTGVAYVYVWACRKAQQKDALSIIDLDVFKNKEFLFGIIVNIISRTGMCGLPILISIMLQQVYGQTVIEAGIYLALIAGASILAKCSSHLITHWGIRRSCVIFAIFTAVSIVLLSSLGFWIAYNALWVACFCFGYSTSFLYTAMNSVLYITLSPQQIPNASNMAKMIQQFSIGLGVVFAVGCFHALLSWQNTPISSANLSGVTHVYSLTCYFLAGIMMLNACVSLYFSRVQGRIYNPELAPF